MGVAANGRWQVGNNCGGYILSNLFDAYANQQATSISAFIHNISAGGPNAEIKAHLYEFNAPNFDLVESSDFVVINNSDKNTWKALPLLNPFQLTAGKVYRVGVEGFQSSTDTIFIATSGTSPNFTSHILDKQGCLGAGGTFTNYYITNTPMIRLNFGTSLITSLKETLNAVNMHVYPNPNTGEFNLQLANEKSGTYLISVSNLIGQQVYSERIAVTDGNMRKTMNLSGYENGVYMLTVTNENSKAKTVRKIVIY